MKYQEIELRYIGADNEQCKKHQTVPSIEVLQLQEAS